MEGDAGTSRLNPLPMPKFRRLRRRRPKNQDPALAADSTNPDVTTVDSADPEDATEETGAEAAGSIDAAVTTEEPSADEMTATDEVTAAEPAEPEAATEETSPETAAEEPSEFEAEPAAAAGRRPSRLGRRGWLAGIAAVLVLCAAGVGAGGYFALRYHHESQAIARNDAAALKAAVDCVSATQAPDTNAMAASEQKIIDCGTDAFRSQALLYTSMLVQAYQAANVHVQVSDMRAAVERNNPDGSVEVLVAVRVKVANDQTQNETGYRLRVKMAQAEGQYKIAKLDQVTK